MGRARMRHSATRETQVQFPPNCRCELRHFLENLLENIWRQVSIIRPDSDKDSSDLLHVAPAF